MPEQPPKTGKTGHLGVHRSKSSFTNISVHADSAPPSCFGTGHVTVLSTPPRKAEYSCTDVLAHLISVLPVRSGRLN